MFHATELSPQKAWDFSSNRPESSTEQRFDSAATRVTLQPFSRKEFPDIRLMTDCMNSRCFSLFSEPMPKLQSDGQ
jgi:hypothetical protein